MDKQWGFTPSIRLPKAIHQQFMAGDAIADLADDFDLTPAEIERLLRLFCRVLNTPKTKHQFKALLNKYIAGNPPQERYEALCFAGMYAHHYRLELPQWWYIEYSRTAKELVSNSLNGQ